MILELFTVILFYLGLGQSSPSFRKQMMFTILLFWFVGCLLSTPSPDLLCVPYVLENECSSLVGNVTIEESEQQDFFDEYVSLNVSNVRMVQESCRRPYLSYLCQLTFGSLSCESSSNEEQHCLEEQSCLQVSDLCSDYFQLDCSSSFSFSPSPTPTPTLDCSEEVKEQIEEVKKKPIQVETCLDGSKEEIECCPDPFIFDDNDECVVQCPQYLYGESIEQWIRIMTFILDWCCVLIFITAMIPLYLTSHLRYPNYVLFASYGSYIVVETFISSTAIFSGGYNSFVCGGEKDYFVALDRFGHSPISVILSTAFFEMFNLCSFSHWFLFSFNFFCYSMRPFTQKFEKFIRQPVNPYIIFVMEGLSVGIPVVLSIACLIIGFMNVFFAPLPPYGYPVPLSLTLSRLFDFPVIIYGGLSSILLVCGMTLVLVRGRQIIYYQWRSLVAGCFWILIVIFGYVQSILQNTAGNALENVFDFIDCVASHPQRSPPPCEQQFFDHYFPLIYNNGILVAVIILIMVTVWTNPLVIHWWKELIFERRVLMRISPESQNFQRSTTSEESELLINR